ncbi:MAG: type 4a pilus biogenesis protein PilO [Candidatus Woesearchaeota archaeon]
MDNKKLNLNKNSYIYGILVLSLLVAIFVGYLIIKPLISDNKKQQLILDNRKNVVKILEDKKNKLIKISSNVQELKNKVENIDKALPLNEDRKGIAYQIYLVASEYGVAVESINDNVSSLGIEENTNSNLPEILGVNPIKFTVSGKGSYQNVLSFLDKLKKSLRLMSVSAITFSGLNSNSLDFSISVTAFTRGEVTSNEQL